MYFVHMGQNPMNSNPKYATAWWDSLAKPDKIVINLLLDPKMRSPLELGNTDVMLSVHGGSI